MARHVAFPLCKFLVPEFVFGPGSMDLAGQYARNLGGRKVLVVSDPGVKRAGWVDRVLNSLNNSHLEYSVYLGVTPNPRSAEVMAGAEFFVSERCDLIVGVGGGSPLDCAKGIGIVATSGRHIMEFEGVDKVALPLPPLIAIPTTTSSSDVSQFAVIDDKTATRKFLIISKAVVPDLALVDPDALATLDPIVLAGCAMDSLAHAVEAFVSVGHSPMTDVHALEGISIISANLVQSVRNRDDVEVRSQLMLAAVQAGIAFSNASLGAAHAMAHSVGGMLDLPHGQCSALLFDHVIDFNYSQVPERYQAVAKSMGLPIQGLSAEQVRTTLRNAIHDLRLQVGLPEALSAFGVRRTDVHELADRALHDPCVVTNPRRPSQRDIEVIYELAI